MVENGASGVTGCPFQMRKQEGQPASFAQMHAVPLHLLVLSPDYSLPRSANRDVWVSSTREELWAVALAPGQKAPLPPSEDAELRRPLDG